LLRKVRVHAVAISAGHPPRPGLPA
jgi:hypothetical protein